MGKLTGLGLLTNQSQRDKGKVGTPGLMKECVECDQKRQKGRLRCKPCAINYNEVLLILRKSVITCPKCDRSYAGSKFLKANSTELHSICLNCRKNEYIKSKPEIRKRSIERARWLRNSTPERQEKSRKRQRDNHNKEAAARYWEDKGYLNGKASYQRLLNDPVRRERKNRYNVEYNKRTGNSRITNAKWRASVLRRTPSWACQSTIKLIYKNCPENMTVDHIIPLQGNTVCGLHVENNLGYLTKSMNSRKKSLLLFKTCEEIDEAIENYEEEVAGLLRKHQT
jgi:hypothetical protein